ncbi:MAG TPA: ATP-binding protein, partial [Pirellulales bacterium]
MSLNNLLASPSFAGWLEGESLDIPKMLFTSSGKPRLAVVSIAHLDDAQRMFFVTILLNEILAWIRTQSGTSNLRALLYMDEVFGYFPPVGNPPSKRPMLTLLKQARAFGLGCVLATQNPVDLDYKGLSNAGTWFLGRLQTERDKARVLEGLEGASAEAGAAFNRGEMEAKLASLGNRVFLMNNVHSNKPVVFQSRWAMSYLRGPLTRDQIKSLMDPLRKEFAKGSASRADDTASGGTSVAPTATPVRSGSSSGASNRPILSAAIREVFAGISGRVPDGYQLQYRPALLGKCKLHYAQAAGNIDVWQDCCLVQSEQKTSPDDIWDGAPIFAESPSTDPQPDDSAAFADLPAELAREKSYPIFQRQLSDHLYRTASLAIWTCELLEQYSKPDEAQADFRARLATQVSARREAERARVTSTYAPKLAAADADIAKQQAKASTEKWQFFAKLGSVAMVAVDAVLRAKGMGPRGRPRSASTAFSQAAKEHGEQAVVQVDLATALDNKQRLEQARDQALADVDAKYNSDTVPLARFELKPRKGDITVDQVVLLWLPFRVDGAGRAEAVYQSPNSLNPQT